MSSQQPKQLYPTTPTKTMKMFFNWLDSWSPCLDQDEITQIAFIYSPLLVHPVQFQNKEYLQIGSNQQLVRMRDGKIHKFESGRLIHISKNPKTLKDVFYTPTEKRLAVIINNERKIYETPDGQNIAYYPYHIISADKLV